MRQPANDNAEVYHMVCEVGDTMKCIADGFDKDEVIKAAKKHIADKLLEDGFTGSWDEYCSLYSENADTGEESLQKITIKCLVERDAYDGGRFDYNSSR